MRSGDRCPKCEGRMVVYATKHKGDWQHRFLRCLFCHHRPERNIEVVPAASIRRRYPRTFEGTESRCNPLIEFVST